MNGVARTGLIAAASAFLMVGAAYASVPLYKMFCAATGFDGTPQRSAKAPGAMAGARMIDVRFDGNVANGLPWDFKPDQTRQTVRIGEKRIAFFRATNTSNKPITGQAAFNVSPDTAGKFFDKIQCFCFTEQTLQPGQTVDMPVVYFVDPSILKDDSGKRIDEITLSYTFFQVDTNKATGQKSRATS